MTEFLTRFKAGKLTMLIVISKFKQWGVAVTGPTAVWHLVPASISGNLSEPSPNLDNVSRRRLDMSSTLSLPEDNVIAQLQSATEGFDRLFANQIVDAREVFASHHSPFHLLGQGVCSFLEAALGMEVRGFCILHFFPGLIPEHPRLA